MEDDGWVLLLIALPILFLIVGTKLVYEGFLIAPLWTRKILAGLLLGVPSATFLLSFIHFTLKEG